MDTPSPTIMKVSSTSDPRKVAGALAMSYREHGMAIAQSIGAGAGNQALKSIIIAMGYLVQDHSAGKLAVIPEFCMVEAGGVEHTAIRMTLVPRDDGTEL